MTYTVLGANGFLGSHLKAKLQQQGYEVYAPDINSKSNVLDVIRGKKLGSIIYCVGITSDFRQRQGELLSSHAVLPQEILNHCDCESFTYLSSTRVYKNSAVTEENSAISLNPSNPDDIYEISKIAGESICLLFPRTKIIRLSNVVSPLDISTNFISSIFNDVRQNKTIELRSSLESAKDYITLSDVLELIMKISKDGSGLYNVASGFNISNGELIAILEKLNIPFKADNHSSPLIFPQISVQKIKDQFDFKPIDVRNEITNALRNLLHESDRRIHI